MFVWDILGDMWLLYHAILSSYMHEFIKYGQCLHPCLGRHHPLNTVCCEISLPNLWYFKCKIVIMYVVDTMDSQFRVYLRVTCVF
jgi:hypothetical protein